MIDDIILYQASMIKPKTSGEILCTWQSGCGFCSGATSSLRLSVEVGPWMGKCRQPMRAGERAGCLLVNKHGECVSLDTVLMLQGRKVKAMLLWSSCSSHGGDRYINS